MNSKRIFPIKAFAFCFVSVVGLAACGGGGSAVKSPTVNVNPPTSNTKHGAVYSYRSNNLQEFRYYYGGNTQAWINNHALTNCRAGSSRSSCTIEAAFTNCVALARDNRIRAYATGNDLASARSSALAQCRRLGGTGCSNFSSNCNAPVTRQASKVGGSSNSIPSPTAPTEQPTPPPSGNVKHGAVYSWQGSSDNKRYATVSSSVVEDTAAAARSAGLAACTGSNSNCRVEFTFTNCAAVADSDGFEYTGIATGNTLASARSSALAECTRLGGAGCELDGSERCNDPVAPQDSIVRGISNSAPAPAPTVTLTLADSSISENGGTTTVTATLSQASGADTTITVTAVSGSYTVGEDATITIAAGSTSNSSDTATINAVDNTKDEPDRTATVTATTQNSQGIGAVTGASLTLEDDDGAPTVTLSLADSSISENGGTTTVTATLSHASSADTTITVTAVSGSYTVGEDATITIAAGSTSNNSDTATINAVDNTRDEADRTATVTATAQNTQGIGAVTGASLTLEDDDGAPTSPPSSNTGHGAVYSYTVSGGQRVVGYHGNEDTAALAQSSARAACNALRNAQGCRVEFTYRNVATASSPSAPSQPTAPSGSNVHYGAVYSYTVSGGGGQRILSYHGNENTAALAQNSARDACNALRNAQGCRVERIFWTAAPVSPPTEQLSRSNVRYGAVYSYATIYDREQRTAAISLGNTATPGSNTVAEARSAACSGLLVTSVDCRVEFTFTNCAAVANINELNPEISEAYTGFASGDDWASATSAALAKCRELGGEDDRKGGNEIIVGDGRDRYSCEIRPEKTFFHGNCLNPITPQASKSGGFLNTKYGAIVSVSIGDRREIWHIINQDSEQAARDAVCPHSDCDEKFTYTNCAAAAWDQDGAEGVFIDYDSTTYIAVATGNTMISARDAALARCRQFGRSSECGVGNPSSVSPTTSPGSNNLFQCNTPIVPQEPRVTGWFVDSTRTPEPPAPPSGGGSVTGFIVITSNGGHAALISTRPAVEAGCRQDGRVICRIVTTFANCGAAAWNFPAILAGSTNISGYGTGNTRDSAERAARANCGGGACQIMTSFCN